MDQTQNAHVFISYSRQDDDEMKRIVSFLRKQKIRVWLDNEKLIPGTPIWEEELEKAVKTASAIVVLMSPDSKKSEWVRREIALAEQYKKRVFPILIKGNSESSIWLRLINHQYIDVRNNESEGLMQLSKAIAFYLYEAKESDDVKGNTVTIGVVGEFSRGKSSLINVLIERNLLPTGFLPTPTTIALRYGKHKRLRLNYQEKPAWNATEIDSLNLAADLSNILSDQSIKEYSIDLHSKGFPSNKLESVEIWCDSDYLKKTNATIIEAAGLGTIYSSHKEITNRVIPNIDVFIFVTQADPGLGEAEVELLRSLKSSDNLFILMNKTDMVKPNDLVEMLKFSKSVLERECGIQNPTIYPVSTRLALKGNYKNSGFPEFIPVFTERLRTFKK